MTTATTTQSETISVLIVDDEKNMRITLSDILIEEGYHVTTASNGEEAVAMCEQHGFDVILMDVRMPGINGVEAFRRIRRHREGVRVIMMSAYSVDDLKQAALDEGAIAFLPKPLDVQKVVQMIGEVRDTAILIVENDEGVATSLHDSLKHSGYRVSLASSPHDALEMVEQIRFDVIFIDTQLPIMNGLELYLAIRKLTPTAVAIMLTGSEDEFERLAKEAVKRTAYTIVRKPLDVDSILAMLHRITHERVVNGEIVKPNPDESA